MSCTQLDAQVLVIFLALPTGTITNYCLCFLFFANRLIWMLPPRTPSECQSPIASGHQSPPPSGTWPSDCFIKILMTLMLHLQWIYSSVFYYRAKRTEHHYSCQSHNKTLMPAPCMTSIKEGWGLWRLVMWESRKNSYTSYAILGRENFSPLQKELVWKIVPMQQNLSGLIISKYLFCIQMTRKDWNEFLSFWKGFI